MVTLPAVEAEQAPHGQVITISRWVLFDRGYISMRKYDRPSHLIKSRTLRQTHLQEMSGPQSGKNWRFQQEMTWNFVALIWLEDATRDFSCVQYPYILSRMFRRATVTPMSLPPCSKHLSFFVSRSEQSVWDVWGSSGTCTELAEYKIWHTKWLWSHGITHQKQA